jgi:hypothetical protein
MTTSLMNSQSQLYYLVAGGAALVAARALISVYRWSQMPPGPKGIPILGNLLQVPLSKPWFLFEELGKKYGM